MFIIAFFFLIFAESIMFASNRQPLATVNDFQGEVVVLRNPVLQKSPEFEGRVTARIHSVLFYQGWYWEVYPLNNQTQVFYGDLINSGVRSTVQLRIQSVHELTLSENSSIQLNPDFIQLLQKRAATPSVHIIAGKMRLKVNPDSKFSSFSARSTAMVLELKKSDLLFSVKGKISQVLSLDGKLLARRVSTENQKIYSQSLEHYRNRKYRELSNLTALRQKVLADKPTEVAKGNRVEAWEAINQDDRSNLMRLLGAERTKTYLETASRFEAVPILEADMDLYADLLPDIDEAKEKLDLSSMSEDDIENGYSPGRESQAFDESGKSDSPQFPSNDERHSLFSVHLGYVNVLNEFNEAHSFKARSLALELEFRPWTYLYSYLAISSGVVDTENMANFLGQDQPQPLNSYSHVALGLGGRLVLWKSLALSMGAGLMNIQRISIQYDDLPSNVNRTYTIALDPIPLGELAITVNVLGAMEVFIRYGMGSSYARVDAKDIASDYKSLGSFSYGTIGLAWSSQ